MSDIPAENTDRELYREVEDDYYANSIFVTKQGSIGMDVGGRVIVQPIAAWHKLAIGNDLITPDPDTNSRPSESPKTAPLQDHIDTLDIDEILATLKIHNKDLDVCFNDAVAVQHLKQLIETFVHHRERIAKAEGKHEQRHQAIGVSRWIAVGEEHGYWKHPMTSNKMRAELTSAQAVHEDLTGLTEQQRIQRALDE